MAAPSASGPGLRIREAEFRDLRWIARLHAQQLPHGFFVSLGPRYLRAYHRSFIDNRYGVALVAERNGEAVGFVVGAAHAGNHRRLLVRQSGLRLALAGVGALLVRPPVAFEFARTRSGRYVRGLTRAVRPTPSAPSASGPVAAPVLDCAVLTHVAVDPSAQRVGAGSALVDAFAEEVRVRGAQRIELVTLADQRGAADFYTRLGWQPLAEAAGARSFRKFGLDLS